MGYTAFAKQGNLTVLYNYRDNGEPMLVAIGAYGIGSMSENFLVWGDRGGSYDDVLDEVADYCEEHAPGLFCDEQVHEAYREAIAEGLSEEDAQQRAEEDTISCSSGNHYFTAHEVSFSENPTREEILYTIDHLSEPEIRVTGKDPLASRKPGNVARRFIAQRLKRSSAA